MAAPAQLRPAVCTLVVSLLSDPAPLPKGPVSDDGCSKLGADGATAMRGRPGTAAPEGRMSRVVHDTPIGHKLYLGDDTGRRWTKTEVGLGGPVPGGLRH